MAEFLPFESDEWFLQFESDESETRVLVEQRDSPRGFSMAFRRHDDGTVPATGEAFVDVDAYTRDDADDFGGGVAVPIAAFVALYEALRPEVVAWGIADRVSAVLAGEDLPEELVQRIHVAMGAEGPFLP